LRERGGVRGDEQAAAAHESLGMNKPGQALLALEKNKIYRRMSLFSVVGFILFFIAAWLRLKQLIQAQ
jgi:hypothetical protein